MQKKKTNKKTKKAEMKRAFLSVLHEYATYCMKFSLESLIGTSLWINCHKYSLTKISCSTTRTVLYKFACILLCLGFQCKRKQFPKKFASYRVILVILKTVCIWLPCLRLKVKSKQTYLIQLTIPTF